MSHETPDLGDSVKNLGKDIERAEQGIFKDQAERIPSDSLSPDQMLIEKELKLLAVEALRLEREIKSLPEGDAKREAMRSRLDLIYFEIGKDFDFDSLDLDEDSAEPVKPRISVVRRAINKAKDALGVSPKAMPSQSAPEAAIDRKIISMKELLVKVAESAQKEPTAIEKMREEISRLAPDDGKVGVLQRRIAKTIFEIKSRIMELKKQMEKVSPEDGRVYVNKLRIEALMAELPAEEVESEIAA